MASDARSRTSTSAKSAIKNRRDMADTPFTLAGVMRRADARRVAVQILLTRFCLNFQGKPCTSCLSKNYPELFALMGGQVPDLRGLFLRGHGGNSAALGVTQGHAMRDISASGSISVGFGGYLSGSGIFKPVGSHKVTVIRGTWDNNWNSTNYGLDLSTGGVPVANEVRPDNQAVRYLIRAIP